jgi:hypothetical protein
VRIEAARLNVGTGVELQRVRIACSDQKNDGADTFLLRVSDWRVQLRPHLKATLRRLAVLDGASDECPWSTTQAFRDVSGAAAEAAQEAA